MLSVYFMINKIDKPWNYSTVLFIYISNLSISEHKNKKIISKSITTKFTKSKHLNYILDSFELWIWLRIWINSPGVYIWYWNSFLQLFVTVQPVCTFWRNLLHFLHIFVLFRKILWQQNKSMLIGLQLPAARLLRMLSFVLCCLTQ